MLNIPERIKDLFKADRSHKYFRARFINGEYPAITNSDVVKESVKFTESICSQDTFRFGLAEESVLEFETVGRGNMYGMYIEASIEIDASELHPAELDAIEAGTWDGTLKRSVDIFDDSLADWKDGYRINEDGIEVRHGRYKYSQHYFAITADENYIFNETRDDDRNSFPLCAAFYDESYNFVELVEITTTAEEHSILWYSQGTVRVPLNAAYFRIITTETHVVGERVMLEHTTFSIPYGIFRIKSCPRNHGAMTHRQVTAYTETTLQPTLKFPTKTPWPRIYADIATISAAATGTGLTLYGTRTPTAQSETVIELFNSAKKRYRITVDGLYGADISEAGQTNAAFFKADMPDYDQIAYDGIGVAIAAGITSAGLNLNYDSSGKKRYKNNEAALRDMYPYLFSPAVKYGFNKKSGGAYYRCFYQNIEHGTLTPVVYQPTADDNTPPADGGAFYVSTSSYFALNGKAFFLCDPGSTPTVTVYNDNTQVAQFTISADGMLTAPPSVYLYDIDQLTGYAVQVDSFDRKKKRYFVDTHPTNAVSKAIYSYLQYGEIDLLTLCESAFEVRARFGKQDRKGHTEELQLDTSNPISIQPGDYSDCWWDEYDISPIGSVIIGSEKGIAADNVEQIEIGTGESLYDMGENAVLNSMTDKAAKIALIESSFAPDAAVAGFTPAELTMQGWPWMEAGDALEIEAEDGTTIETFALRVELRGIQNLTATITAQGGQVIEEV